MNQDPYPGNNFPLYLQYRLRQCGRGHTYLPSTNLLESDFKGCPVCRRERAEARAKREMREGAA